MSNTAIRIEKSRITAIKDHLGSVETDIELFRIDDCKRPLIGSSAAVLNEESACIEWEDTWGGPYAYAHQPDRHIRPHSFDSWGDPNTHVFTHPVEFSGRLNVEPVEFGGVSGFRLHLSVSDRRSLEHPLQHMLKIPVGYRIPYKTGTRVFGLKEMYLEPEIINCPVDAEGFQDEWFYMEAELFGKVTPNPMDGTGPEKSQWGKRIHCGAPIAVFREGCGTPDDSGIWWAVSGEPDYGAALKWRRNEVIVYTTLYLNPGDTAEWQSCIWRQAETEPENVYLTATMPDGFYDQMNPPGIKRKGVPEGPITFININRPQKHFEELEKVRPGMVILNYIYDHVSCVANMYGTWKTYEGFTMTEEKLKDLIARIKAMGAKVGFYGTSVEQPESHKALDESDIVLDRWGRRFNAWEPGNWVVDAGNNDCADRLAKAEAEFASYYGFECVFVDRLDHLSVNANPARAGQAGNTRLQNIPSVRLGIIELNKKRIEWQRKLNPDLYIGLNNTTQWIGGVRYSDFNLLEGGMDLQPPIFFLNAPHGLVHKQHYNIFFCDFENDIVDHGIVQGEDQLRGFNVKRRALFLDALADGVLPEPYEDEIFVAPDSQFFKGWNNRELPDEVKWDFYKDKKFYGGKQWRADEDLIASAMETANRYCFPVARVWTRPEGLAPQIRFSARRGCPGGYYIGVRNETSLPQDVDFVVDGLRCRGTVPSGGVIAWFCKSLKDELLSLTLEPLV